jgi:hypothetical protein
MSSNPPNFGFSLFCDDVRQEVGGKLSFMGIYQADMVFPHGTAFPIVVPRFVIVVKYFEVVGAFTDDLFIEIFLPEDKDTPSARQEVKRSEIPRPDNRYSVPEDSDRLFVVQVPMVLSPFIIREPGFLRVRMNRGENRLKLGSLLIRAAEEAEKML